jgi:hypothetical protein
MRTVVLSFPQALGGSGLGGSQGGGVCPFVDVIARQNGSVVFFGGFDVGEGWLEGLVSVHYLVGLMC